MGLHSHALIHLPADRHRELRQSLYDRLRAIFDWDTRREGRLIRGKPFNSVQLPDKLLSLKDAKQFLDYMHKGMLQEIAKEAWDQYGVLYRRSRQDGGDTGPVRQGTIYGKRAGTSHSLGKAARQDADYRDLATLADIDRLQSPMMQRMAQLYPGQFDRAAVPRDRLIGPNTSSFIVT
jgi:hypothetical protein